MNISFVSKSEDSRCVRIGSTELFEQEITSVVRDRKFSIHFSNKYYKELQRNEVLLNRETGRLYLGALGDFDRNVSRSGMRVQVTYTQVSPHPFNQQNL